MHQTRHTPSFTARPCYALERPEYSIQPECKWVPEKIVRRRDGALYDTLDLEQVFSIGKSEEGCSMVTHLEKPLQPPDLKEALAGQHHELEDAPPLDARIRALSRVPVRPLANNNVALLVLDLCNEFRHLADCDIISICHLYSSLDFTHPPSPTDPAAPPPRARILFHAR